MTTPLGRLSVVPARDVWPHEARDFTPWLLENVDVLSDLLGMDLVLDVAEHPVGGFSLDLFGRDEATGQTVIVENQLEMSDHTHLGQILTYAAGTNPTTIVWVTTGFRPEHRAAIDWLNERTDEDTRFFGVEIEVVRIGDSVAAPSFKLVAEPNDWEKHVRAVSGAAVESSAKAALYWDFWERCRTKILAERPGWTRFRTSTRDSWFSMPAGKTGVAVAMSFTRDGLAVQLVFEHVDPEVNDRRYAELAARRDAFEAAAGGPVSWEPRPRLKSSRISIYSDTFADVGETERWDEMITWLIDQQERIRRAVDLTGGLPA